MEIIELQNQRRLFDSNLTAVAASVCVAGARTP
jgi:hypothetical protein